jgi:hypothetical protein
VRALAERAEFLEACAADADAARLVGARTLDALLGWAAAPPLAPRRLALLRAGAIAGPALFVAALGLGSAGLVSPVPWLTASLAVNLALALLAQRPLGPLVAQVTDVPRLAAPVLALIARIAPERVDAEAWRAVQARLAAGAPGGAVPAIRRLARLLAWAEVRYSPLAHWALNATVALDAGLVVRLERWRRTAGAHAAGWLDALADAEAMIALATLAHEHPAWAFATLDDGDAPDASHAPDATTLDARALGHPLLPEGTRVGNDVRLGGAGSVLVVSGSNMAGKTTLLRAVGANVLLAQAGGPVCAAALRWRRVRVRTSVQVHDALEAGVSLFLAELRRLRGIVDDAAAPPADGAAPAPVLYLLDEVLHGTNSQDRRAATRAVLARLAAHGAVGVVTTHDLELADEPALAPATVHRHFRERYVTGPDGPRMTFDYVARDGRAPTANALALLEALGLGPPPGGPPDQRIVT